MNHRKQYMQSSEQCYTEGNTFIVFFWFASGVLFEWGTGSRRRGPNISESNGPGRPIISGDPSLCDRPKFNGIIFAGSKKYICADALVHVVT